MDRAITALIPRGVGALPESAAISVEDLGETYRVDVKSASVARARRFVTLPATATSARDSPGCSSS